MNKKEIFFFIAVYVLSPWIYAQTGSDTTIKSLILANDASKQQIQQLSKEVSDLRLQLQKQQRQGIDRFTVTFSFLDAAISSANNLQSLILKESYRNKIASLNNPTSNELGFSLEVEIQNALKPLIQKVKKTNTNKFGQVVESFLQTGQRSSVSLFPAGNIFTSIVGMVGNLTVQEKGITQDDLNEFIRSIEKYFNQYERLYQSNLVFNGDMQSIKIKIALLQDDIRYLIQDLVLTLDKTIKRDQLKKVSSEELLLQYFNKKENADLLSKAGSKTEIQYPQDAVKSCKEIANNIQRIYNEYSAVYDNNFKEIRGIISDTKSVSGMVDQIQLNKTLKDVETLYNESKTTDAGNIRLKTLFERLEAISL